MSKIRVGDVFTTNEGCECVVVEYVNSYKVGVKFLGEHVYEVFVQAGQLRKGEIKNPYHPSVFGVGFLGVGEHKVWVGGKITKEYSTWNSMLNRCYDSSYLEKHSTYKGCYVRKDWHNFQEFAKWFDKQYKEDGWQMDKDILKRGNKEYSEYFCRMVPQEVNTLLIDRGASRGELPLGVCANGKGFKVHLTVFGKQKRLGTYTTPTEAFLVYRQAKEVHIKEVANLYKDTLCQDVYNALMSWEIECDIYNKMAGGGKH